MIYLVGIDPPKINNAIMKHNSARGANTMQFPIRKFAGGANTIIVKTINSNGVFNLGRAY